MTLLRRTPPLIRSGLALALYMLCQAWLSWIALAYQVASDPDGAAG